jgi:hypothetical protein
MCPECRDAPCPIAKGIKRLLRVWLRERKRQGAGMFRDLPDPGKMQSAVSEAIDQMLQARCDCPCHEVEGNEPTKTIQYC